MFTELANLSKSHPDTLYVEYGLADKVGMAIALLNGKVSFTTRKLDPNLLEQKVRKYLGAVQTAQKEETRLAKELYEMLLGDLGRKQLLGTKVKRICIVADGPLLELPFAALILDDDWYFDFRYSAGARRPAHPL